jgi:hypothetical protein
VLPPRKLLVPLYALLLAFLAVKCCGATPADRVSQPVGERLGSKAGCCLLRLAQRAKGWHADGRLAVEAGA